MAEKVVRYDIDGYEVITSALRDLVNQFPGLDEGDEILYSVLNENSGKALFPVNGATIENEAKDIIGNTKQICVYPFYVIYRAAGLTEERKASVKEWLDNLGRWLERQPVEINGEVYRLESYPILKGNREFMSISRQSPSYCQSVNDNKSENWSIAISARYSNEF